jgi:hypothetical protein
MTSSPDLPSFEKGTAPVKASSRYLSVTGWYFQYKAETIANLKRAPFAYPNALAYGGLTLATGALRMARSMRMEASMQRAHLQPPANVDETIVAVYGIAAGHAKAVLELAGVEEPVSFQSLQLDQPDNGTE